MMREMLSRRGAVPVVRLPGRFVLAGRITRMLGQLARQNPFGEALLHEPEQRREVLGCLRGADQGVHRHRIELRELLGSGHSPSFRVSLASHTEVRKGPTRASVRVTRESGPWSHVSTGACG